MKSCSRSYRLHMSFCSGYCCIYVALRGLPLSVFLYLSHSLALVLWLSAQGVESSLGLDWDSFRDWVFESCVTKWGKRYKVLIKIVFSCTCYYKGACSQVRYRLGLEFRQELGLGIENVTVEWAGGWPGWAASGRAASHHSSCLCMHIKVKISNGDNDKRTHSWAELSSAGLGWSGTWWMDNFTGLPSEGFAEFHWVSLVCFPYGKQKAGGRSQQGEQCFHWC